MAADNTSTVEPTAGENTPTAEPAAVEEAYITPTVDFVLVLSLACLIALAGAAVVVP